jgi:hypothetical protein
VPAAHLRQRTGSSGKSRWVLPQEHPLGKVHLDPDDASVLQPTAHPVWMRKSRRPNMTASTKAVKITNRFGIELDLLR